jgi:hypothetical protein
MADEVLKQAAPSVGRPSVGEAKVNLTPELKAAIDTILSRPYGFTWTVQGFGMLRTYLGPTERYRLNLWDDRLRMKQGDVDVSDIHTHPWDFSSLIVAGQLANTRLDEVASGAPTHWRKLIKTGEEGEDLSDWAEVCLVERDHEFYTPGATYRQAKAEIHYTRASRGTITLNDRTPKDPASRAYVYDKLGRDWRAARPRLATMEEIRDTCQQALGVLRA